VGTHIDAPSHFLVDGATIDQLPPSTFIRPALVLDVSHKQARECITWDSIEPVAHRIRPGMALLFHTGWSRYYHNYRDGDNGRGRTSNVRYFDHPWLAADVAQRLVALGVRLIGTDAMSPDQSPVVNVVEDTTATTKADDFSSGAGGESDFGVHKAVLYAGGLIVENLTNLDALLVAQEAAGPDEEIVVNMLPLKISGCDGSPVRAVAWVQPRGLFS
jgi:kynurenine formamidase